MWPCLFWINTCTHTGHFRIRLDTPALESAELKREWCVKLHSRFINGALRFVIHAHSFLVFSICTKRFYYHAHRLNHANCVQTLHKKNCKMFSEKHNITINPDKLNLLGGCGHWSVIDHPLFFKVIYKSVHKSMGSLCKSVDTLCKTVGMECKLVGTHCKTLTIDCKSADPRVAP